LVGSFVSEADVDGVLEIEWLGKLDMAAKGSSMEVMDDSGAAKEGFEFGIRMWLVKSQEHHQTKKQPNGRRQSKRSKKSKYPDIMIAKGDGRRNGWHTPGLLQYFVEKWQW